MNNYLSSLRAAFLLCLVSIPMSIGISIASDLPPSSGLISAVIGGVIVGIFSPSKICVSGPAAGLIALTVTAVQSLGSSQLLFFAILLAGIFQIVLSIFKLGFLAEYFPSSVVRGMMFAIGLMVIFKQFELLFSFQAVTQVPASSIFNSLNFDKQLSLSNLNIANLLLLSPAVLVWGIAYLGKKDRVKNNILSISLFLSALLYLFLLAFKPEILEGVTRLESLHLSELFSYIQFKGISNLTYNQWFSILYFAMLFFFICSLESVLTINASERIDPHRKKCSRDRELFAQGLGNIFCGVFGGLPIAAVIARTTLNAKYGSNSKYSTILHGIFLITSFSLFHDKFNLIPLTIVSLIMIFVGLQLSNHKILIKEINQGLETSSVFITTALGILLFGIEFGILIGLLLSCFFVLKRNSNMKFNIYKENNSSKETLRIILPTQLTFLNSPSLVAELDEIPPGSNLVIDATYASFIDNEIIYMLKDFSEVISKERDISVNLVGFKRTYNINDQIEFIDVPTVETLSKLSPFQAIKILHEGNVRFIDDKSIHRHTKTEIYQTKDQQSPFAAIVGCIDSRVPVETVFDVGFGEVFCARVAGNIMNMDIIASLEYAVNVVGSKAILVLGHTACGAVQAACDKFQGGNITTLLEKVSPALSLAKTKQSKNFVNSVTVINVANTMLQCFMNSDSIQQKVIDDQVAIYGGIYDVGSGRVMFYNLSKILQELSGSKDGKLKPLTASINYISEKLGFGEPKF